MVFVFSWRWPFFFVFSFFFRKPYNFKFAHLHTRTNDEHHRENNNNKRKKTVTTLSESVMKSRLVQNSRKKRTYNTTIGFFSFFLYLRLVCLFYCFKFVKLAVKIFYSLGVFSLFIFCIISKQPHFFGYLFVFFLLLLLSISYMVMVICLSLKKSPNYMFSLLLWIKYG